MRKLTALAVAAALTVPAAVSAAEIRLPQVYGRFHMSLNHMDNGDESVLNLSNNSSRLGVRGNLDLTEELQAFYQMEAGFDADQGGGNLASRNTFAGLRGAFGAVQAGQFDTPVKNIGSRVDLFGDQVGDNGNIIRYGVGGVHFDQRQRNLIQYTTPSFSGLEAQLAYSTNIGSNTAQDGNDDFSYMAALNYTGVEGLYVGLGYQAYGKDVAGGGEEANIIRLGASYQVDALKLTALLQRASDLNNGGNDVAAYGLGAAYTLGKAVLKAQYYLLDHDAAESNADMVAIGLDYKLAKSFTTYVAYSRIGNDDDSSLVPYRDGINDPLFGAAGRNSQSVSLGAIYNF